MKLKNFRFHVLSLTAVIASLIVTPARGQNRYVILSERLPEIEAAAHAHGGILHHRLKYLKASVVYMNEHAAAQLQARFADSAIIEPDLPMELTRDHVAAKPGGGGGGGSASSQTVPWGISAVQAPAAWSYTRGAGVLVGVVDTGIQPDHPDLQANIVGGENFSEDRNGLVDPALWADDNGHGTHVSGTIAALDNSIGVVGVAPEAKLFAAKVFYKGGSASNSTVADAIMACVARHVDIINLSMSGGNSDVLQWAVTQAYDAGIVLVAAAGNNGFYCSTTWPANYIEVLSISAIDSDFQLAGFSSYGCPAWDSQPGKEIDFAAPGVGVLSTYLRGGYRKLDGTSMAAPHVSGVIALMISAGAYTGIDSLNSVWLDGLTVYQQGRGLISAVAQ